MSTSTDTVIPAPDGWTVCDMKEDAWSKNERAHQKLRARKEKNIPLCCICLTRNCIPFENVPIRGNKSMKKSKYVQHNMTKFYRHAQKDVDFFDVRNGETPLVDEP